MNNFEDNTAEKLAKLVIDAFEDHLTALSHSPEMVQFMESSMALWQKWHKGSGNHGFSGASSAHSPASDKGMGDMAAVFSTFAHQWAAIYNNMQQNPQDHSPENVKNNAQPPTATPSSVGKTTENGPQTLWDASRLDAAAMGAWAEQLDAMQQYFRQYKK
ncbi:MAG: hypothetical protein ACOYK8_05665 [Alphaproteobacteria bacterium]